MKALFILLVLPLAIWAHAKQEDEFEKAWKNPAYTKIEFDVDINSILKKYYKTPTPLNFTATMLWDMETKKAWSPIDYIPYVVSEGKSWNKTHLKNGDETFVRSSQQKQWLNPNKYDQVFESVYVNNKAKKVTFIGETLLTDAGGKQIKTSNHQPIFHVQHSVKGTEENPVNGWRIVHLTKSKDQKLISQFKQLFDSKQLPGYIEIYIKNDLKIPLSRQ